MSALTYESRIDELMATVPEIRDEYEEDKREWLGDDYLPHVIFGISLNPYVENLLRSGNGKDILQRVFASLEEMARSEDERVQNVLAVTVCEHLSGQGTDLLTEARKYMGEETRQVSHEIAVGWGHEPPYEDDPPEIWAMAPPPQFRQRKRDGS